MNEKNICPMCNKKAIKLIPLYDHDNAHKLQLCCRDCKKKIKTGVQIEKFIRREKDEHKEE